MLVGTKCDDDINREVIYDEGKQLANQLGCQFMETSAKDDINVSQAFKNIITQYATETKLIDTTEGGSSKKLYCKRSTTSVIIILCGIGIFLIGLLLFIGVFKAQIGVRIGIGILCVLFCCGFSGFAWNFLQN